MVPQKGPSRANQIPSSSTLLDKMVDGREFESLIIHKYQNLDLISELRKSIQEVKEIRKKPIVCYVANVVQPRVTSVSIEDSDDLPFNEMISSLPKECKEIDIVLVTPGGLANQVAKFINVLRPRFDKISFILLNKTMSAGTIFIMSGDEIIMTKQSQIGPIDPQVRSNTGSFVPAQALLTFIEDVRVKGEVAMMNKKQPSWTDLQILRSIDPKEIGNVMSASRYAIQLVEEYLYKFKFKNWTEHKNGIIVTDEEKKNRANEIASLLCKHSQWKSHGHAITREDAWALCKLKIVHAEEIEGLERAMRRMWALFYWMFENSKVTKCFISEDYCIMRSDPLNGKGQ